MIIISRRRVAVMMAVGGTLGLVQPAPVAAASPGDDGDSTVVLVDAGDRSNAVQLPVQVAAGDWATFASFQSTEVTIAERNGPSRRERRCRRTPDRRWRWADRAGATVAASAPGCVVTPSSRPGGS